MQDAIGGPNMPPPPKANFSKNLLLYSHTCREKQNKQNACLWYPLSPLPKMWNSWPLGVQALGQGPIYSENVLDLSQSSLLLYMFVNNLMHCYVYDVH